MTDRTADEVIAAVAQEIRGAKGHFTHGVVGIAIEQLNKWADRLASVDLVSRQPQETEAEKRADPVNDHEAAARRLADMVERAGITGAATVCRSLADEIRRLDGEAEKWHDAYEDAKTKRLAVSVSRQQEPEKPRHQWPGYVKGDHEE